MNNLGMDARTVRSVPWTCAGYTCFIFILMIGLGIIAIPTGLIASALTKIIQDEKTEPIASDLHNEVDKSKVSQ